MFKVIIVDDEHLIRNRLRYGFNWDELGYELIGEAANGLEAIDLIERFSPDVAIVDIAMPNLNGLELTKILRGKGNDIKIILLTGHSKFEYAREALAEHVHYYMLKPIDEDEFIKTLRDLASQLNAECSRKLRLQHMEYQIDNAMLVLEGKFFHDLFNMNRHGSGEEKISRKLKEYNIGADSNNCILLLEIERFVTYQDDPEVQHRLVSTTDMMHNIFKDYIGYKVIYDIYNDYVIVVMDLQKRSALSDKNYLVNFLSKAKGLMECHFNCPVNIALGSAHTGIEGLINSYREAEYALRNCFVFEGSEVVDYEVIQPYIGKKYRIQSITLSELTIAMQADNFAICSKIIEKIFDDIISEHILYKEIQGVVAQIISGASKFASDNGIDIQDVMGEYADVETVIKEASTVNDVCAWCTGVIEALLDQRRSLFKKIHNVDLAKKVQRYILDNFSDPELSLEQISGSFFIAATYISSNFKRVNGLSIMQYITKIRLEKARDLLAEGGTDIKTVAVQTGYSDEYYFSRCFKKYFGISPSNYVKAKLQKKYNN